VNISSYLLGLLHASSNVTARQFSKLHDAFVLCGSGIGCGLWANHATTPEREKQMSRLNRSKDTLRDRILHVLSGAAIPMDVENVRIKSGLKNWESTKALLLELVVEGLISGQKTTKSWVFWVDHRDTRMSIAGRDHA
jgi:hypothetical protein